MWFLLALSLGKLLSILDSSNANLLLLPLVKVRICTQLFFLLRFLILKYRFVTPRGKVVALGKVILLVFHVLELSFFLLGLFDIQY